MKINIDDLTEEELIELNHKVVERLRLIRQIHAHKEMFQFKIGDRVSFHPPGRGSLIGILTRFNKKSVTAITDDGGHWTVHPTLLQRVPESSLGGSGRNPRDSRRGASKDTARREITDPKATMLMEAVVERKNMTEALRRVEKNGGAAGIDGMAASELRTYLKEQWSRIKESLLAGSYQPQPVRRVEIPKVGGKGMRVLGIPTVIDRLIQQGLHQVLSPIFDKGFSESSYGFRPGRSAHGAVKQAWHHVSEGKRWVVDTVV